MEKAIIVKDNDTINLNVYLASGWSVKAMCPMPSSAAVSVSGSATYNKEMSFKPQCLVIIEEK